MIKNKRVAQAVRSALLATSAASLAFTGQVWAAEEDGSKEDETQKIVVTGSRIKRNQAETAQPVVIIDNKSMQERGYTTVFEALNDLSQNTGVQIEGPEFSGGFTPGVETLNLRSSGVGTSLTLINGRRVASYPAAYQSDGTVFNFGAIPTAAVDRIEILTTGASAIYGSDAISGVVNIILRKDVDASTVHLLYGVTENAGKSSTRLQFVTGHTSNSGNITATFEYQDREGIYGTDYGQYDSQLDFPYGTGVLNRGVLNLNWWNLYYGLGDAYVDPGEQACTDLGTGMPYANRPGRGNYCGYDGAQSHSFRNPSEKYSMMLNANYELTSDLEVFGTLLYYQSESESKRNGLWISEDILDLNTINTDVNYYEWYLAQRFFTEEELGKSTDSLMEDQSINLVAGLKGIWGLHDWELSVNHSQYEFDSSRTWWKAEKVVEVFLGNYLGVGFAGNNWWDGQGTWGIGDNLYNPLPANVAADLTGAQTYGNETSSQQLQFVMSGELGSLDAGPINYALVVEYEKQDFDFRPDARIQQDPPIDGLSGSGWWQLTGYNGTGDREKYATGIEVDIPLHEDFILNVAGRVDSYDNESSSIGTRFTPAMKFEWRPSDNLLIRGGYSGSFRAPDMQLVFTETGFYTGATDFVSCYESGDYPNDCESQSVFVNRKPANQIDNDAEALKDETGYSSFVGFVLDMTENATLTMTWNEQYLKNIAQTESIQGLLTTNFACLYGADVGIDVPSQSECDYVDDRVDRVYEDVNGTQISYISDFDASPVNRAENIIQSVDASFRYGKDTDIGRFSTQWDYTHVLKSMSKSAPGDSWFDRRDYLGFSGYNFRSRMSGSLTYSDDDFTTTLTAIRRGSTPKYNQFAVADGESKRLGPLITYNMTAQYTVNSDFAVGVRVVNLFDRAPPKDNTMQFYDYPFYNIFTYGGTGTGREIYLEAEYNF